MTCTLSVHSKVLKDPVAYKYYVQSPTLKKPDHGFEDLHIPVMYGKAFVNRRLFVEPDKNGMDYSIDSLNLTTHKVN